MSEVKLDVIKKIEKKKKNLEAVAQTIEPNSNVLLYSLYTRNARPRSDMPRFLMFLSLLKAFYLRSGYNGIRASGLKLTGCSSTSRKNGGEGSG